MGAVELFLVGQKPVLLLRNYSPLAPDLYLGSKKMVGAAPHQTSFRYYSGKKPVSPKLRQRLLEIANTLFEKEGLHRFELSFVTYKDEPSLPEFYDLQIAHPHDIRLDPGVWKRFRPPFRWLP
ncbi:MAG: hypothetical protein HY917_00740 [Candidatus Diapherotrites archaeon]|nr:hypothetical protein [Candidatus Diapherotrites archaeon]